MERKNLFELYSAGKLPQELQKETKGFAENGKTYSEEIFRAGYYLGHHYKKVAKLLEEEKNK